MYCLALLTALMVAGQTHPNESIPPGSEVEIDWENAQDIIGEIEYVFDLETGSNSQDDSAVADKYISSLITSVTSQASNGSAFEALEQRVVTKHWLVAFYSTIFPGGALLCLALVSLVAAIVISPWKKWRKLARLYLQLITWCAIVIGFQLAVAGGIVFATLDAQASQSSAAYCVAFLFLAAFVLCIVGIWHAASSRRKQRVWTWSAVLSPLCMLLLVIVMIRTEVTTIVKQKPTDVPLSFEWESIVSVGAALIQGDDAETESDLQFSTDITGSNSHNNNVLAP